MKEKTEMEWYKRTPGSLKALNTRVLPVLCWRLYKKGLMPIEVKKLRELTEKTCSPPPTSTSRKGPNYHLTKQNMYMLDLMVRIEKRKRTASRSIYVRLGLTIMGNFILHENQRKTDFQDES